jgi:hypothetical protein
MINGVGMAFNRLLRRRISEEQLLEYISKWLSKPPVPKHLQTHFDTLTGDGQTFAGMWREGFLKLVSEICSEPSWTQQKRCVLRHIVREIEWIALFEEVKSDDDVFVWKNFVENVDGFVQIDEPEKYFYPMLFQRYIYSTSTYVVLGLIG